MAWKKNVFLVEAISLLNNDTITKLILTIFGSDILFVKTYIFFLISVPSPMQCNFDLDYELLNYYTNM